MKKGVQDAAAFNNLVQGHSLEGNPDGGCEILRIMVRKQVVTEANSCTVLVESYLRSNQPTEAKSVLDSMIEQGHSPEAALFGSVMQSLFDDRRVQTASRVMKLMIERGVDVGQNMGLVGKVLEALFLRGHVEEALGRVELLLHGGFGPDLNHLLSLLCEKGKTIAAMKLLDFGLERECDVDFKSYEKVLDALLSAGKTLNAYSILCKMMQKGGVTDWSNCKELIKSLNEEGNSKQADILSRMMSFSKKGKMDSIPA